MKTISFEHTTDYDFTSIFQEASKEGRLAYNRIEDGLSEEDVRAYLKEMFPDSKLSVHIQRCVIEDMFALKASINTLNKANKKQNIVNEKKYLEAKKEGKPIKIPKKLNENITPIFGGKKNWDDKCKGKITNEEWKQYRLKRGLYIIGEENQKGNRHFELHIDEGYVVLKLNRKEHIRLDIKSLGKNLKKDLLKLQFLNDVKNGEQGYTYTVRITFDKVYISFEPFKQPERKLSENTFAGIDLNPKNIGFSICSNKEIKHTTEYSFIDIFDEINNSSYASDSKEAKYLQNKLNHELFETSKHIISQCLYHGVKFLFIEDLKFGSASYGRWFNRQCKNLWKRNKFIDNLKKRCAEVGIKVLEVNPAYSSIIGNLMYDFVDSVNASLEIARRGFEFYNERNKENKMFYPHAVNDALKPLWKKTFGEEIVKWEDVFKQIKTLNIRVRVFLEDTIHEVFELKTYKSRVKRLVFT